MALIKCPECRNEVSDRCISCPNCGFPIESVNTKGTVRIKMPNNIAIGWVGLFSSRKCSVDNSQGKTLWQGQHGENASFTIDGITKITINLGGWANPVSGTVEPRKKYSLVQDLGAHMFATYRLTEVDVIDSD